MTAEFSCIKNQLKFGKTALNPIYGFLVALYPNYNIDKVYKSLLA